MLWPFLFYSEVYVYLYPLPLDPSFHSPTPIPPSRSLQGTKLSSLCSIAASCQLSI